MFVENNHSYIQKFMVGHILCSWFNHSVSQLFRFLALVTFDFLEALLEDKSQIGFSAHFPGILHGKFYCSFSAQL